MDIIGLPDLANSITSLLDLPDGSTDYFGWMFWVGIFLLIIINWPFIKKLIWKSGQKKEPSVSKEQNNDPVATLIEEIKQSDSWYVNLKRPLDLGVSYTIHCLEMMRLTRNEYDFSNLVEVYYTVPGKWTNQINDLEAELRHIIECMDALGYIKLEPYYGREKIGVLQGRHGAFSGGDRKIVFTDKYLTKFGSIQI